LTTDQLAEVGVVRLPSDLQSALDALDREPLLRSWFSTEFIDLFLAHKAGEIAFLKDKEASEVRRMYMNAY
jgi:glutamine synthetase